MSSSQQSPINLINPIYADLGADRLKLGWDGQVTGLVVREKEEVKLQFFPENGQSIELGGKVYQLDSLHFHHPSEHMIQAKRFDMELHLVHTRVDDGIHFAVIAVFIEMSKKALSHPEVDTFLKDVARILNRGYAELDGRSVSLELRILLPPRDHEYYRYEGSLTTPDYSENVSWVVIKEPFQVDAEELGDLIHEFKKPARNPLPLNRRFLLATFRPDDSQTSSRESVATSTPKRPSKSRSKAPKQS